MLIDFQNAFAGKRIGKFLAKQ